MRWLLLASSLFATQAFAQDVGSTMYLAADADSKRFPDADTKGALFALGDEVTVLFVEGSLVRVTSADHYGWVPATALTATDPNPSPLTGGAPGTMPKEFSMEALQQLLDRTKEQ